MLNTKSIIEQVKDILKSGNKEIEIPINTIVGIDQNDELVYIEDIHLYKYSSNPCLRVDGMTFRKITVEEVEERRSEDWAYEERDLWVGAVQGGYTDDSLLEWWEDLCNNADGLYPFDDDSYRSLIEEEYDKLSKAHKNKIEEAWGAKGDPYEDLDEEVNRNSDWLTVYCGSSGGILTMYNYSCNNEYSKCVEQLEDWKVCLYPQLIKFLMQTIDELKEKEEEKV